MESVLEVYRSIWYTVGACLIFSIFCSCLKNMIQFEYHLFGVTQTRYWYTEMPAKSFPMQDVCCKGWTCDFTLAWNTEDFKPVWGFLYCPWGTFFSLPICKIGRSNTQLIMTSPHRFSKNIRENETKEPKKNLQRNLSCSFLDCFWNTRTGSAYIYICIYVIVYAYIFDVQCLKILFPIYT